MTDITLTDMKFEYGGAKPTIHFDPPLASFREARERLVQMDQEALKALGLSDIRITNFIPPYADALSLVNFSVCILTWAAFGRPANFQPGSLLFDSLLFRFPAFASFCSTIQPFLFPIMALIHAYEVTLMMTKLERHSLLMDSWQWWAWVGSCFVEGWTSFKRLNGLISEKTREKESKKH
ncbi:integral membrane protein-like protein [Polyplosphaeria fusca]|uniref:Integral membrane protein-like protein n=1 Tax=Polyplosphaeria fusca TaxID=682080 RepID=A0A9P4V922_9PLEO|nr:integral membrane protein-like protein [Polyplosphaeria fusca]